MILHPGVTGVVLAGGRARRLQGIDKSALQVGPGPPRSTLARILDVFEDRFAGCVLVAAPGALPGSAADRASRPGLPVTVTEDRFSGCGPLGGIHAGLCLVTTPHAFACGCDMPSLSASLLDLMARRAREGRLLVPVSRGRPEPLHALYPITCLPAAERALQDGVRMMLDFFERVPVDWLLEEEFAGLEGAGRSFANINTPGDLEAHR